MTLAHEAPDERSSSTDRACALEAHRYGKVSLDLGDAWLKRGSSALLLVPSVVVPEDFNVLINPRHPAAGDIKGQKIRQWTYDGRLRWRSL